ncbi:RNA polymerase II-associated protein 3 [Hippocampus comes]|uniref:RNA polymerase II-associated protein 3 n=1 Tax=Hippocampus comes TaxID=109280 RepID=UPI00094E917A|nr:PREDICTED: RNA polymerase II-associated protein 3-like [Hippocampus comes]
MDSRMHPWRTYRNSALHGILSYQDDDDDDDDDVREVVMLSSGTKYDHFDFVFGRRELLEEVNVSDTEREACCLLEQAKIKEKAEKKRLKKQRQKERKRQEKMEKEKENGLNAALQQSNAEENSAVGDKLPNGAQANVEVREEGGAEGGAGRENDSGHVSDQDAEELDMTSCFVSQTAQRVQHKLEAKPKPEKAKQKPPSKGQLPKKSHDDIGKVSAGGLVLTDNAEISNDLAARGNKWAHDGRYDLAVDCFTQAIQYNPTEIKLFGNRAFCLEKMQEYEKALADAELCLNMSPGWIKGLFRKGRALAGLKRYEEAAHAFQGVLKLDASCAEAAQEMMRMQILQLMVSQRRPRTNQGARTLPLLSRAVPVFLVEAPRVPAASGTAGKTEPPGKGRRASNVQKDGHPELFPVWVGNLTTTVTEQLLSNMFSKAGSLHSVKLLLDRRCAFVNFTRQECCDTAIRLFHNFKLMGNWIAVRYPDRIPAYGGFSKTALKAQDRDNSH